MALVDLLQAKKKDLVVQAGDSARLELRFRQGNAAIDMSGYSDSVARVQSAVDGSLLDSWAVDFTNAATGVIVLSLTTEQTDELIHHDSVWYFKAILASDPLNNSHTVIGGDFSVTKPRVFSG